MQTEAPFYLDVALPGAKSVEDDGSVLIEGLASDFDVDREDEAFEPGAFRKSIDSFLESNPVLLYHHKNDHALGQVLELDPRPEGLFMKARIDKPAPGSWAEDVVQKVKTGTIRGLSVRGLFKKRMTPKGPRIYEADLAEISVTPFPVNPRTLFTVAGKAFPDDFDKDDAQLVLDWFEDRLADTEARLDRAESSLAQHKRL